MLVEISLSLLIVIFLILIVFLCLSCYLIKNSPGVEREIEMTTTDSPPPYCLDSNEEKYFLTLV